MENSRQPGVIVPAIILIGVGVFFLLSNAGLLGTLNVAQLWPIFPVLTGVALLVQYFAGRMRDPDLVTGGSISLMIGLFFFLFTLNVTIAPLGRIDWSDMARLWPAFPTIVGLGLALRWLVGGLRETELLIPVTILFIVGFAGFGFTLAGLPTFSFIFSYWPVLLIVIGVIVLLRSFRQSSSMQ